MARLSSVCPTECRLAASHPGAPNETRAVRLFEVYRRACNLFDPAATDWVEADMEMAEDESLVADALAKGPDAFAPIVKRISECRVQRGLGAGA